MRGTEKQKNIVEQNKKSLKSVLIVLIALNAISLLLNCYFKASKFVFIVLLIIQFAAFFSICNKTKPVLAREGSTQKIVSVRSLLDKGVISSLRDVMWYTAFVQLLIIHSKKWMIILLLIPISFIFDLVYNPYKMMTKKQ